MITCVEIEFDDAYVLSDVIKKFFENLKKILAETRIASEASLNRTATIKKALI